MIGIASSYFILFVFFVPALIDRWYSRNIIRIFSLFRLLSPALCNLLQAYNRFAVAKLSIAIVNLHIMIDLLLCLASPLSFCDALRCNSIPKGTSFISLVSVFHALYAIWRYCRLTQFYGSGLRWFICSPPETRDRHSTPSAWPSLTAYRKRSLLNFCQNSRIFTK